MRLYWSARSPFVRKVMITLHETGQLNAVELVETMVAVHLPPTNEVRAANPLGKIPVLQLGDGVTLFDSRVICEFLDRISGAELFPEDLTTRMTPTAMAKPGRRSNGYLADLAHGDLARNRPLGSDHAELGYQGPRGDAAVK